MSVLALSPSAMACSEVTREGDADAEEAEEAEEAEGLTPTSLPSSSGGERPAPAAATRDENDPAPAETTRVFERGDERAAALIKRYGPPPARA